VSGSSKIFPVLRTGNRDNELYQLNKNLFEIKNILGGLEERVVSLSSVGSNGSDGIVEAPGDVILRPGTGSALVNDKEILTELHPSDSVVFDGDSLSLDGDVAAPGSSFYYGTDSLGVKGYNQLSSNSVGIVRIPASFINQSVTSATYTAINGMGHSINSVSHYVLFTLLLNFATSGTSGTILLTPIHSLVAPSSLYIGAAGSSEEVTTSIDSTGSELTCSISPTSGVNNKRVVQVALFGNTTGFTTYGMSIKKGTISSSFTITAISGLGNLG